MNISQKCQYALRAIFELARRGGDRPTTTAEIAAAQSIPPRFLELIPGQLKRGKFIDSRRGAAGGYLLAVSPTVLSAGDIIRFIDGPISPVKCVSDPAGTDCPLYGNCAFLGMWRRAGDATAKVYDETTFQDLLDTARDASGRLVGAYCI